MGPLKIVTLTLLVDVIECTADGNSLNQYIENMITSAGPTENGTAIIDHSIESEEFACTELEDSVANDTYAPGDFVRGWLAMDAKRGRDQYWSNTYKLVSKELAGRFKPIERYRPHESTIMVIDQ